MNWNEVGALFRALPEIVEAEDDDGDLLSTAQDFSKTLRKLGLRQMQEVREALSGIAVPENAKQEVRAAWQREQERAVSAERQAEKLALVLVGALDQLHNLAKAMEGDKALQDWSEQVELARTFCHREAGKVGLVTLASPGDSFNPAIQDATNPVSSKSQGLAVIVEVRAQGYLWNGSVLRRALVRLED